MRFLHFSTADGPGGAAKAAYRLHAAVRGAGHTSRMLVRQRVSDDDDVHAVQSNPLIVQLRRLQSHLPWGHPPRARFTFNQDREPGVRLRKSIDGIPGEVDVVCLHWISTFLTARSIRDIHKRLGGPLLWVMMDQEPVTGGCHYSFGCDGYQQQCGNCPLLARPFPSDHSRQVFLRKQRHLSGLPITFVAPTSWAEEKVRASALFGGHHVERIALAIDTAIFRPGDRAAARAEFGIPTDKRVVFFGSSYLHEPRKGSAYLIEALKRLHRAWQGQGVDFAGRSSGADTVLFVMAGQNGEELNRQLPFPSLDLGYLRDERRLALAYQAADVFVCPSIEDAGPMMVPESLLCGTPVVAFNTGGAPDLIVSGQTGYLARACDAADLAWGIEQLLESPYSAVIREAASNDARRLHDPKLVAARYVELVSRLLERESTRRTAA